MRCLRHWLNLITLLPRVRLHPQKSDCQLFALKRHIFLRLQRRGPLLLIDSHAHIDSPRYAEDRAAMLARAWEAGVGAVLAIGIGEGPAEMHQALEICREFNPASGNGFPGFTRARASIRTTRRRSTTRCWPSWMGCWPSRRRLPAGRSAWTTTTRARRTMCSGRADQAA